MQIISFADWCNILKLYLATRCDRLPKKGCPNRLTKPKKGQNRLAELVGLAGLVELAGLLDLSVPRPGRIKNDESKRWGRRYGRRGARLTCPRAPYHHHWGKVLIRFCFCLVAGYKSCLWVCGSGDCWALPGCVWQHAALCTVCLCLRVCVCVCIYLCACVCVWA